MQGGHDWHVSFDDFHFLVADECIGVPASLLAPNFTCTEHVKVQPIRNVATAIHLWVEPCTVEDWELVELDAAWLEQGGLLQQVSLVYTGQIVTVRLSHGTTVRLLVLPSQQSSSLQSDVRGGGTEVWPTTNNAPPPCWRLDATTQVVVVPKPRRHAELLPKSQSLRLFPSRQDYIYHDAALLELAAHVKVDLIDVLQGSAVIHPNTLAKLTTASESTIHNDDSDSDNPLDLAQAFALVENADEQVIVKINTSDVVADDGIGTSSRVCDTWMTVAAFFQWGPNTMLILTMDCVFPWPFDGHVLFSEKLTMA
jgi:Peroxisome biogenesis factor 1, N-terminal